MKRSRSLRVLCGALLAIGLAAPTVAPAASSGPAAPQTRQIKQPTLDIQPFTLKNGLRVYVVEQHHAPVVTVNVTYNVGSRDERPGRTGFAHLFEHMMFQGSANVGKAEHFKLINDYGGVMNGSTSFDRTNYFQTMPAHQLEDDAFFGGGPDAEPRRQPSQPRQPAKCGAGRASAALRQPALWAAL